MATSIDGRVTRWPPATMRCAVYDVATEEPLPNPAQCRGVVITGSHAMVTDALPWSVRLEHWIPKLVKQEIPLLGICYGHQLLAHAMGGRVGYHPVGREIGTVEIELLETCADDALFSALPPTIEAHVVHAQTVVQLPREAVRLARNDFEPNHAFRIGRSAWGVQFHPEYNQEIMHCYVTELADELEGAGYDVPKLMQSIRETPAARQVTQRFAQFVLDRSWMPRSARMIHQLVGWDEETDLRTLVPPDVNHPGQGMSAHGGAEGAK